MTNALPDLLSDLLVVGLADLKACENDADYRIKMTDWHKPIEHGLCEVCMAGAVMAKTLGTNIGEAYTPFQEMFGANSKKLMAINEVRAGNVRSALRLLDVDVSHDTDYRMDYDNPVGNYHTNPVTFIEQMNSIVEYLVERGL